MTASHPSLIYTLYLEYFATGEGLRQEIMVTLAKSEEDARQRFLDRFYPDDLPSQTFFSVCLDATVGVNTVLLARWLSPALAKSIEDTIRYSGDFYLHRYFNMS